MLIKENKDKIIANLRKEVTRLENENKELIERIDYLEASSTATMREKLEQAEKTFNDKIAEVTVLEEKYRKLVKIQEDYNKLLKAKMKKGTDKAIKEFKKGLKRK